MGVVARGRRSADLARAEGRSSTPGHNYARVGGTVSSDRRACGGRAGHGCRNAGGRDGRTTGATGASRQRQEGPTERRNKHADGDTYRKHSECSKKGDKRRDRQNRSGERRAADDTGRRPATGGGHARVRGRTHNETEGRTSVPDEAHRAGSKASTAGSGHATGQMAGGGKQRDRTATGGGINAQMDGTDHGCMDRICGTKASGARQSKRRGRGSRERQKGRPNGRRRGTNKGHRGTTGAWPTKSAPEEEKGGRSRGRVVSTRSTNSKNTVAATLGGT